MDTHDIDAVLRKQGRAIRALAHDVHSLQRSVTDLWNVQASILQDLAERDARGRSFYRTLRTPKEN
jgi:hypothetical protein